jgi:hypothetical protein
LTHYQAITCDNKIVEVNDEFEERKYKSSKAPEYEMNLYLFNLGDEKNIQMKIESDSSKRCWKRI